MRDRYLIITVRNTVAILMFYLHSILVHCREVKHGESVEERNGRFSTDSIIPDRTCTSSCAELCDFDVIRLSSVSISMSPIRTRRIDIP